MSPVFKFAAVFVLGLSGLLLAPKHACRLSSPMLLAVTMLVCLVAVPVIAARTKKAWIALTIAVAAPFISFANSRDVLLPGSATLGPLPEVAAPRRGAQQHSADGSQPFNSSCIRCSLAAGSGR
jgi:hypothetical protein